MKRLFSVVAATAVLAGAFAAPHARAEHETLVQLPRGGQINDRFGDSNYLNDQAIGSPVPDTDDKVTPADVGSVSDIGMVWFTHTADTISAHIQTEVPAPASTATYFRVLTAPGAGEAAAAPTGCLRFHAIVPGNTPGGGTYQGPPWAVLQDYCNDGTSIFENSVEAKVVIAEATNGTGVLTITGPRDYSPLLSDGRILDLPYADVATEIGFDQQGVQLVNNYPKADTTKRGARYTVFHVTRPPDPDPDPPKPPCKKKKNGNGKAKGHQKKCAKQ